VEPRGRRTTLGACGCAEYEERWGGGSRTALRALRVGFVEMRHMMVGRDFFLFVSWFRGRVGSRGAGWNAIWGCDSWLGMPRRSPVVVVLLRVALCCVTLCCVALCCVRCAAKCRVYSRPLRPIVAKAESKAVVVRMRIRSLKQDTRPDIYLHEQPASTKQAGACASQEPGKLSSLSDVTPALQSTGLDAGRATSARAASLVSQSNRMEPK